MRVALISPLFESVPPRLYGGTERVVDQLARGLMQAGVDVTLFASGDSRVECELVPVVEQALRLRARDARDVVPDSVYDSCGHNFKMLMEVYRRARDFDVIHNHHDCWMLPLTEMTAVPLLTTLHGRLDLPEATMALGEFPKARFISISDSQQSFAPELPWMRTIHHGLDLSKLRFQPEPGQYLAFLGRISPEKRPEWAIEIAYRAGVPLKIAAKIEGRAGQDYYDRFIKPHVDGKFIEYVGEISEAQKSDFLGNALALVFPIDWPEPFGLVLVEALACGTPVLTRPCGAAPELMKPGVTGFCLPDLQALAEKVDEVGRLDRAACRCWVEERFSLSRMTEDYLNVYRSLISGEAGLEANARHRGSRRAAGTAHRRRDLLHPHERSAYRHPKDQSQG